MVSAKNLAVTVLALVSRSDPLHLITSLHSHLSYAFRALYLDRKFFEAVSDFHALCTTTNIYTTQSQLKMSSDTEMTQGNCVSLFLSGKILL